MDFFRICVLSGSASLAVLFGFAQIGGSQESRPVRALPPMGLLRDVGMSSDGKYAFAGDANGVIWVWDVPGRKLVRAIHEKNTNRNTVPCCAFSADGRYAAIGHKRPDGGLTDSQDTTLDLDTLTLWDLREGKKVRSFPMNGEPVSAVAISPDGKRVVSIGLTKFKAIPPDPKIPEGRMSYSCTSALRLWNTKNGKLERTMLEAERIGPIAFAPNGKYFADIWVGPKPLEYGKKQRWALGTWKSSDGGVRSATEMAEECPPMQFPCMAISPDGKHFAVGGSGVSLWSLDTKKVAWSNGDVPLMIRDNSVIYHLPVTSVAFSSDGKRIVAAGPSMRSIVGNPRDSAKRGIVVIDTASGKIPHDFTPTKELVRSVLFSPDDKMLLGCSVEGLRFWDARTGAALFTLTR